MEANLVMVIIIFRNIIDIFFFRFLGKIQFEFIFSIPQQTSLQTKICFYPTRSGFNKKIRGLNILIFSFKSFKYQTNI